MPGSTMGLVSRRAMGASFDPDKSGPRGKCRLGRLRNTGEENRNQNQNYPANQPHIYSLKLLSQAPRFKLNISEKIRLNFPTLRVGWYQTGFENSTTTGTFVSDQKDQDRQKGALEQESTDQQGNTSMQGQLGHRDQDPMLKSADTDFPEPGESPEHTGEPSQRKRPSPAA